MTSMRPEEWRRPRPLRSSRRAACRRAHTVRGRRMPRGRRLHRQVSALLDAHEHAHDFLETACVATVAAWPDEDLTGAQFGPFLLESRIGGGGMGEVYRARDTRLGRTVAIKVLQSHVAADEPARERFEREARVVAGLNHPHICTLHDIGTYRAPTGQGPVPYLVMEFLEGETLADRLTKGSLPVEDALDCAIQIASALDTAHRAAIVHRDLKPRNVMLTSAGAKLLDFGIAKAAAPPAVGARAVARLRADDARHDHRHAALHGPRATRGSANGRTHGSVCLRLRALRDAQWQDSVRRPKWREPDDGHHGAGNRHRFVSSSRRVPNGVEQLIVRCLAKNPDDRWQSAADLLDELRRIAGAVRSARESGWFRRFISEHRVAGIGVLVTLVLSAGVAAFLSAPTTPAVPLRPVASVQLAVLPLRMVGEATRGDEYLGVGIADSIITRLAAIRSIGLRPTAAVIGFANTPADTATVAKTLAVGHVLFGTIQRTADTYRITLQLVQSSDGAVVWARQLRRAPKRVDETAGHDCRRSRRRLAPRTDRGGARPRSAALYGQRGSV